MDDPKATKTAIITAVDDIWFETKKRLDDLGGAMQWADLPWREEGDPDNELYEALNSLLARGDAFVREVERLRDKAFRPTVYFLDYSASMTEAQVMKGFEIIKERVRRTTIYCGIIGFDTQPSVICDMLPGRQTAQYARNPIEVRNATNGVNGGGGTCVLEAIKFCDERRFGGLVDSFKGDFRGVVRKVLVTDGDLDNGHKLLFDEIVIVPYEPSSPEGGPAPSVTSG